MADELVDVDAIVFDLDGVLVDVSQSYRRAIVDSIEEVHGYRVEDQEIQLLKDAGGFNNDWDVTYALALMKIVEEKLETVQEDHWFQALEDKANGLDGVMTILDEVTSDREHEEILESWNRRQLRETFQELYLGSERYEELEGGISALNQEGYIDEETVLLDVSVREKLQAQYPIGILTGRPRAEAEIALERVGLFLDPDLIVAMEDWDNSKPQPEALMKLAEIFEARALVYVGDTLDDVRMTQNANHAGDDRRYYGFGTLTGGLNGEEGRRKFLEEGAHTVIKSVNELLNYLE